MNQKIISKPDSIGAMTAHQWLVSKRFVGRDCLEFGDGRFQIVVSPADAVSEARRLAYLFAKCGVTVATFGKRLEGEVSVVARYDASKDNDGRAWVEVFGLCAAVAARLNS